MSALDLSLAIPCYNEAEHIESSVPELLEVLEGTRYSYEVLFVDDGSTDGTPELLARICARHPRCRYVVHERNRGRGAAFKTGFLETSGRITGFIDIDLEVHPRYIPSMVAQIDRHGFEVATGYRHYLLSQTGGLHREVLSLAYRWLCKALLGLGVRDTETGCKFFRRETASGAVLGAGSDGWFWDTEVMCRAVLEGLSVIELPVLFLRNFDKTSTVRLVRDSVAYLRELFRFRRRVWLSSRRSLIYRSAWLYERAMALLYRGRYGEELAELAALVPRDSSVVDLCAGAGRLYLDHLRDKGCRYLALDANPTFVMAARKRGVPARLCDVRSGPIPPADYVVMCSSLYHFQGEVDSLLGRMRAAARRGVIVSEPVQNLSAHRFRWLGALANRLTDPGVGEYTHRYNLPDLRALAQRHGARLVQAPGRRNALLLFEAAQAAVGAA